MRLPSPAMLGAVYGISEICLALTRRSGKGAVSRDRHSLPLLWIVILASVYLSLVCFSRFRNAVLPYQDLFYLLGLVLFVCGIFLRWYSIWYLGRYFTVDVSIATGHRVIDTGPYRFIRHPSYAGALLAFTGFGFALGNWMSILCIIPILAAFFWRIHVEERALLEALGESYRVYMRGTRRLIPGVY